MLGRILAWVGCRVISWFPPSLASALPYLDVAQMSGDREKKYSQVYFEKDADGRPSEDGVFAVEDAKQVRAALQPLALSQFL